MLCPTSPGVALRAKLLAFPHWYATISGITSQGVCNRLIVCIRVISLISVDHSLYNFRTFKG